MAKEKNGIISRRSIIKAGVGLGAIGLSSKTLLAKEANKKNLPPNVPEWTETLGDGVDVNPYGCLLYTSDAADE